MWVRKTFGSSIALASLQNILAYGAKFLLYVHCVDEAAAISPAQVAIKQLFGLSISQANN